MKKIETKKITAIGMFCALAFIAMVTIKIPVVLFLKYEPKDVIVTMCGLIYGPAWSLVVSLIVSFVEMITVSDTGFIGFIMNVLSTTSFACTAAIIYKKGKSIKAALIGLILGTVLMTVLMVLWNYLLTPIYMNQPRAAVASLLLPAFLPFNLIKGSVNATLTYLLYRPCIEALRKAGFAAPSKSADKKKTNVPVLVGCSLVLIVCIILILVFNGII